MGNMTFNPMAFIENLKPVTVGYGGVCKKGTYEKNNSYSF